MATASEVLIVHAVDTEGPLHESLDAKFERLRDLYGIRLEATEENLAKLQRAEIPLGGQEEHVRRTLSGHLLNYMDTWDKVDAMVRRATVPEFRNRMLDSYGRGWVYNWFFLDHVGYATNARRRDIGYHNIFDHYHTLLRGQLGNPDGVHWHFHPMSTYREAHRCATSYVNSPHLHETLCRRILERGWFPSVFRAGFQAERPDSNLFLEQWIPFDLSNMAMPDPSESDKTMDFRNGRSADWRLAPSDWSIYHPSHDSWQRPGACRRWIGRGLNILNRAASVDQAEMDKAFARAAQGQPALVGVVSHDFRDLGPEVEHVRALVRAASERYPRVKFRFCEARDAFRRAIWPEGQQHAALELEMQLHPASAQDVASIEVRARAGEVFGPQPFLAIETVSRRFLHDNLDFDVRPGRWFYAFHPDTLPLEDVARIGVGASDAYGNTSVRVLDIAKLRGIGLPSTSHAASDLPAGEPLGRSAGRPRAKRGSRTAR